LDSRTSRNLWETLYGCGRMVIKLGPAREGQQTQTDDLAVQNI
jgi:hypothetical protein